ncbi:MAG: purine-nucleoside/S-methyl-5-thioadenosine phosphorylase / adenosine deaminase, partial [Pseudonocardiales bacterium]|nr:purine-nucleoside/S-methyl-5-thioadenosine phosphorylase / adenosine deaminase [Pseudonocardiales bacterium]
MFGHWEVRLGVGVAVTDRHGGGSAAPYAELNLAGHVGDAPDVVAANRERVRSGLSTPVALATMRQVHGTDVAVLDGPPSEPPEADALVTAVPGLALMVLVADCVPVLLWDRRAGVIAAVHAGRRGLAGGVLRSALKAMSALGARADRIYAAVGPSVCPEHYEVPASMQADVEAAAPGSAATTTSGAPALDIRAGLLAQLHEAGVRQGMVM